MTQEDLIMLIEKLNTLTFEQLMDLLKIVDELNQEHL